MPKGKECVKVKEDRNPQNFFFLPWSLDNFKLRHSTLDPEIWVTLTKAKKSYAAALRKRHRYATWIHYIQSKLFSHAITSAANYDSNSF
jgi:hypothetical protein